MDCNYTFTIDFDIKLNSVWFPIKQKGVIKIQTWFNLTIIKNRYLCVSIVNERSTTFTEKEVCKGEFITRGKGFTLASTAMVLITKGKGFTFASIAMVLITKGKGMV